MTEIAMSYSVETSAIAENPYMPQDYKEALELAELEQLNLKVAAIAGWESVEIWNLNVAKKTFTGTNKKHPELGNFVPDYTSDLNAIAKVFRRLNLFYQLAWMSKSNLARANDINDREAKAETEAIALCKLLTELTKPEPKMQIVDYDGEIGQ